MSQDSIEELRQVFVDGSNGLAVGVDVVEVVCDFAPPATAQGPHLGGESEAVGGEDDATRASGASLALNAVPRRRKQGKITDFFLRTSIGDSPHSAVC